MTTLQITLDEQAAAVIGQKARLAGKSPEAWIAEVAVQQAGTPHNKEWIKGFLENADQVRGNSAGAKWTRNELYDR